MLHVRRRFDARDHRFAIVSSLGITKHHRVVAAELVGDCVLDPSQLPKEPDPRRSYLVVVVEGAMHLRRRRETVDAGSLVVCRSRSWLHDHERMVALGGYRAIMMHVDCALLLPPSKTILGVLSRGALRSARTLHDALTQTTAPRSLERAHDAFVSALRAGGVPLPEARVLRQHVGQGDRALSEALGASLSMTAGNPAIVDVASVLARAERTTRRKLSEVAAEYGLAYPRWQTLRQRWRLALAALMLTLPDVTPDDVRREVAFASTATLCHALRRAGLPSPRAIQRAAADTRSALAPAPHTHISADSRKSPALEP